MTGFNQKEGTMKNIYFFFNYRILKETRIKAKLKTTKQLIIIILDQIANVFFSYVSLNPL